MNVHHFKICPSFRAVIISIGLNLQPIGNVEQEGFEPSSKLISIKCQYKVL